MPPAVSLQEDPLASEKEFENEETKILPPVKASVSGDAMNEERPFPWNAVSDRTYFIAGCIILLFIIIPSMTIILLSNILGFVLLWTLYDYNPVTRTILLFLRTTQQAFFKKVAHYILLDPRDASYLPWMLWGIIIQPLAFYFAFQRFRLTGRVEVSTFCLYHLFRVGNRHQMFAHHATLVHKEGHAHKYGLYRNVLVREERVAYPKWIRKLVLNHVNAGIAGLLYGTIPNHYATAHNKIHHRWHNDTGDVHTNMDLDRTLLYSYILYLPRFIGYWTGISPALLFYVRGEYTLLRQLLYGMMYYYTISAIVWYKFGSIFYWAYMLHPLLESASFLGLIAYLWHCFSDEADPTNQYINSITIVRGGNNVWNEDYHVVHHHEPTVHWSDMEQSFHDNIRQYVKCRATVFGDCEQGMLIHWLFGKKWKDMTDHFVDLQYIFPNGDCNKDKLYTMKQLKQVYDEKEEEYQVHFDEIQDLLLRRLRYHYRGTRKDEASWRDYNARLNDGVRDFETISKDKQS